MLDIRDTHWREHMSDGIIITLIICITLIVLTIISKMGDK